MSEQEIMEKLRQSTEKLEIPEQLEPKEIQKKLEEKQKFKRKQKTKYYKIGGITAAAVCMMFVFVSACLYSFSQSGNRSDSVAVNGEEGYASGAVAAPNGALENESVPEDINLASESVPEKEKDSSSGDLPDNKTKRKIAKKQDAGDLYLVAKDYGQVYDKISQNNRFAGTYDKGFGVEEFTTGINEDGAERVDAAASPVVNGAAEAEDFMMDTVSNSTGASAKKEYSKTNLQTEGVDESDIIKTDGSYIYTVNGSNVTITDVTNEKMQNAGSVHIPINSAADIVMEMFIDKDTLNLIVQREDTDLKLNKKMSETDIDDNEIDVTEEEGGAVLLDESLIDQDDYDISYYMDSVGITELFTYDISDRKNPVLKGSVTQQGYYHTSRKINNIIYLFTGESIGSPYLEKDAAVLDENTGGWIPLVNGKSISADCIYLPSQNGNQGLIISSVDVNKPDEVIDNTMILNNSVEIYVSMNNVYLYNSDYSYLHDNGTNTTQIAKFALNEGEINAVGASSVRGEIYDTFAINEDNGKLRVLTTDWSKGEDENQLYILDEKMNLIGSLENIAKGEQIYAARFLGNTAYFVTYRNTDPLFAVDLSDERNPVILSELKITGFSEYLHFWGDDKLLGIGFETDEKSGERKGIKLTMFDITNPADLKTINSCVIENIDYSPALYEYKCVLVDNKENLIGFTTETYGKNNSNNYLLFSWENGSFQKLMSEPLNDNYQLSAYRGIYIGDVFYLVHPEEIDSYDRKNSYQWVQKLLLSENDGE